MRKALPQFISVLFHPILVPTWFIGIILWADPFYRYGYSENQKWAILELVTLGTILPGLAFLLISRVFFRHSIFGTWTLKQRTSALFVIGLFQLEFWYLMKNWEMDSVISGFFLSVAGVLLSASLISFFYKISIHSAAWGGALAGLIISFGMHGYFSLLPLLSLIFIWSIATSSRIARKEHTIGQVWSGLSLAVVVFWFLC